MNRSKNLKLDHVIFWPPVLLIAALCAFIVRDPAKANDAMNIALGFITNNFGWLYEWYSVSLLGIAFYLMFSKYGNKKLGEGKPEFSTMTWIGMMFAAGSSASLMYWGTIEFYFYLQSPPFGAEPFSVQAAEWASCYGMYHWGILGVSTYCVFGVAFAYNIYVKKKSVIRPSSICGSVLGDSAKGWVGKVFDMLFIIGVIAAVGTSLGLGTPLVAELLSKIFGIEHNLSLDGAIIIAWTILFATTVYFGLQKGIKFLSDIRVYLAFGVLIFFLLVGPTSYMFNTFTDAIGHMAHNFVRMTLYTDPHAKSGFPQGWTVFYLAWFVTLAIQFAIYLARISKGRTVRELVAGGLVSVAVGAWIFFGVFGNYAMDIQARNVIPIGDIMAEQGIARAIVEIWATIPLSTIILPILLVYCFISTATYINGVAYTLAMVTTKEITENDEPGKLTRVAWALVLGCLGISLLMLGGLKPVQTSSIVGSLPMMFVCIVIVVAFFKDIKGWDEDTAEVTNSAPEINKTDLVASEQLEM